MAMALLLEFTYWVIDGENFPSTPEEFEVVNFLRGTNVIYERAVNHGYSARIQTKQKIDAGVLQKELSRHLGDGTHAFVHYEKKKSSIEQGRFVYKITMKRHKTW